MERAEAGLILTLRGDWAQYPHSLRTLTTLRIDFTLPATFRRRMTRVSESATKPRWVAGGRVISAWKSLLPGQFHVSGKQSPGAT